MFFYGSISSNIISGIRFLKLSMNKTDINPHFAVCR